MTDDLIKKVIQLLEHASGCVSPWPSVKLEIDEAIPIVRSLIKSHEALVWTVPHIKIEYWKEVKMAIVGSVAYPFRDLPEVLRRLIEKEKGRG